MHIIPFKALYPNASRLHEVPALFDTAKEEYLTFLQAGFFLPTEQPAIFLYEIQTAQRTYAGVLTCAAIEDYLNEAIKKHEATLLQEEEKQMHFILQRKAAVKPVLLVYRDAPMIDQWISQFTKQNSCFFEHYFEKDDQTHRLWAVQNIPDIQALQALFAQQVEHAYIADGHHRMSAMSLIATAPGLEALKEAYESVYCAFFPATQLEILAFNRWVKIPTHLKINDLKYFFEIIPLSSAALPTQIHQMTVCTSQGWFLLRWRQEVLQAYTNAPAILDTMLLNEKVLKEFLGIEPAHHDQRIAYIEAANSINFFEHQIKVEPDHWGFCLFPLAFDDLVKIVEAGDTLPPKSTWFEPRMKNGLLVKAYP